MNVIDINLYVFEGSWQMAKKHSTTIRLCLETLLFYCFLYMYRDLKIRITYSVEIQNYLILMTSVQHLFHDSLFLINNYSIFPLQFLVMI